MLKKHLMRTWSVSWHSAAVLGLAVAIFLMPTNLFYVLTEEFSYTAGLRIDYLIPKVYLSSLAVIGLLLVQGSLWLTAHSFYLTKLTLKHRLLSVGLLVLGGAGILMSQRILIEMISQYFLQVWHLSLLLLGFSWATFVSKSTSLWNKIIISYTLLFTVLFQTGTGLLQFITQQSVGGYYFLGEPDITRGFGLATEALGPLGLKTLAYGTTAHPNVLAGFSVFYTALLLNHPQSSRFTKVLSVTVTLVSLLITHSGSAALALLLILLWVFRAQVSDTYLVFVSSVRNFVALLSLTLPCLIQIFESSSYHSLATRRYLQTVAIDAFASSPLTGIGLRNFSLFVANLPSNSVRFAQPVHHVGLLIAAEVGLLGLTLLGMTCWLIAHHAPRAHTGLLIALIPIMSLDHYAFTIVPGILLTATIIGVSLQPPSSGLGT